jgi:hypothetical protein
MPSRSGWYPRITHSYLASSFDQFRLFVKRPSTIVLLPAGCWRDFLHHLAQFAYTGPRRQQGPSLAPRAGMLHDRAR